MFRFLLHRLCVQALPTLWAIVTISFLLVRLTPGSPFTTERNMPEVTKQALEAAYGLDQPLAVQYLRYVGGVLQGDLGPSMTRPGRSVRELIETTLPVSLELGCWALLYATLLGVGAGILAAMRPNAWPDHLVMLVAMFGICVPSMVMGPVFALVFGLQLNWLPVSGWETAAHRVLPVITLGSGYAAYIARLARGGMLEELSRDYIRTARAKGLGEGAVVLRHALRGGIQPVVSFLGPAAAGLLTGAFVVESIFNLNGLGRVIVGAALERDGFTVVGVVLLFGALMVFFNTLVDVLLAWLNPRVRLEGKG